MYVQAQPQQAPTIALRHGVGSAVDMPTQLRKGPLVHSAFAQCLSMLPDCCHTVYADFVHVVAVAHLSERRTCSANVC